MRVVAACASLVVFFEASVLSHEELAALLELHCGPGSARPAPVTSDERISYFALGYALVDPFGEVREVLTLLRICGQAFRDLSRRPRPSVFFHSVLRLLIECALFDALLPPPIRTLLRFARGFNTLLNALPAPAASY